MATSTGELEQLVLLALLQIGPMAYGAEVRRELKERVGREVSAGTIYPTLSRLERKGLVRSWMSDPIPERGGRQRRMYVVQPAGREVVRKAWADFRAMVSGLEEIPGAPG